VNSTGSEVTFFLFKALMVIEDVPVPVITMLDEVLIQVKAASVDLVDIKICSGYGRVLRKQLSRYNHVSSDLCNYYS
jgi:NADPH:quinone reductase-like Zn-dependent oxidoreductase